MRYNHSIVALCMVSCPWQFAIHSRADSHYLSLQTLLLLLLLIILLIHNRSACLLLFLEVYVVVYICNPPKSLSTIHFILSLSLSLSLFLRWNGTLDSGSKLIYYPMIFLRVATAAMTVWYELTITLDRLDHHAWQARTLVIDDYCYAMARWQSTHRSIKEP